MAKSLKKYFSGLTKNTFFLACASLFSDISSEMLYPILPIFITQTLHANGSVVGLIEGVAEATQNISQGFSGWLADKFQKRKSIALIGYFLAALAKPLMGVASLWQGVLGGRFLDRLGTGVRSAPRDALVASSVTQAHRGKAFGLEGIGDNLGAFLGPLIAVVLLSIFYGNIRLIFYVAIIPGLLAFLMVTFVKEGRQTVTAKSKLDTNVWRFPKTYWHYLLVTALFALGNSSNSFLILQTQSVGISLVVTILIYAGFNLVAALISYPAGFLSDHFGRKHIILASFIIYFIAYLGFALSQNVLLIGLLFILYGLYQGTIRTVGKAFASDFVPERLRASGIGWYTSSMGLLQLFASIVAGLLWDHIGHAAVFYYGAFFALVGSVALMWMIPNKPN